MDPHGAQSAGGLLGYREVIFISLELLHSVLPLRWPPCLIPLFVSAGRQQGVGGMVEEDSSYVSKDQRMCSLLEVKEYKVKVHSIQSFISNFDYLKTRGY